MKKLSNIFFGLACMFGIPVSAHFISDVDKDPYILVASANHADSLLPLVDNDHKKHNYRISSVEAGVATVSSVKDFLRVNVPARTVVGLSKQGRKIEAYFFPGTSDRVALVIGGVHGSELTSIDVARNLIAQLSKGREIYYNVVIVPSLFPDNAHAAESVPSQIGSVANIGRYSGPTAVDPNRQMPSLGKAPDFDDPEDHHGRDIEKENVYLMQLIADLKPSRIVNIHAIRIETNAGIYADPRTDFAGSALGFSSDSSLAVQMSMEIAAGGGYVPGNKLAHKPSCVYLKDPQVVPEGRHQARSLCGIKLPGNRGAGVSLGAWASTAVCDESNPELNRPAMRLITMEFPGYAPPRYITDETRKQSVSRNIELYTNAISKVFLQDKFVEEILSPCARKAAQ